MHNIKSYWNKHRLNKFNLNCRILQIKEAYPRLEVII